MNSLTRKRAVVIVWLVATLVLGGSILGKPLQSEMTPTAVACIGDGGGGGC